MEAAFCVETFEDALARYGRPEIFNTDQGSGPGRADPASVQARVTCDIILVRILFAMVRPARAGMENVRPTN
jgi:hypothetical protein